MTSPDYGQIIRRSWEITWKNKWLWVYGLVLATMAGSGGGNYNSFSNSFNSSSKQNTINNVQNLPEQGKKVLGDATNIFASWLSSVPATTWILLGLGLFLFLIFAIMLNAVLVNWAKASLISGLWEADNDKPVGLVETSKQGLKSVKNLIIFGFISVAIFLVFLVVFTVLLVVCVLISKVLMYVVLVLGILTFIVFAVILTMVEIYAERLIVLKNIGPWEAWKKSLSLSKGNFLNTVVMGLINSMLGCAISCVGSLALIIVLAIPGVVLALPMFANGFHFVWISAIGLFILFLLGIYANLLFRAVLVVFNTGNWNLFFKQIDNEKLS